MRVEKVIWFGIVFSTFIYAAIAYATLGTPEGSFDDAVKKQYTLILYPLALATFIAGLVLPGLMRSPARTKLVVVLAMFESVAVYGLLAAFLARDWRLFIPAWIVSLIGMLRVYPSGDSAEDQHVAR